MEHRDVQAVQSFLVVIGVAIVVVASSHKGCNMAIFRIRHALKGMYTALYTVYAGVHVHDSACIHGLSWISFGITPYTSVKCESAQQRLVPSVAWNKGSEAP